MNGKHIAVVGTAVLLMPLAMPAQMDPAANPYPQSPQNISQPSNQPGYSTPPTGAQTYPANTTGSSLGAPGDTGQRMLDKQFVRMATEEDIADVKMGTLAVEKGGPGVKDLAQKMIDDHTTLNKEMATVADSMGVLLPKMSALSGKNFDTEYLTYTLKAHWQGLHDFYMESSVASDTELQSAAVKELTTMHQHLRMIDETAKSEGITLPPRPPRKPPVTTATK
jgi:putative membrane protein